MLGDMNPLLRHDRACAPVVGGIDEVGRGCIAGPVVVGACVLVTHDPELATTLAGLDDSKRLTPARRDDLAQRMAHAEIALAVFGASAERIDAEGLGRTLRALMHAAAEWCATQGADVILCDGTWAPPAAQAIVQGDRTSAAVAAAAVWAKVHRDADMIRAEASYPDYGFARHKGYPTPAHLAALDAQGPCALHRQSTHPVSARSGH